MYNNLHFNMPWHYLIDVPGKTNFDAEDYLVDCYSFMCIEATMQKR